MKHENENDRITILDFYKAGSDNSVSWDGRYNHQCQTHSEGASLLTNTSTGPLYGITTRRRNKCATFYPLSKFTFVGNS